MKLCKQFEQSVQKSFPFVPDEKTVSEFLQNVQPKLPRENLVHSRFWGAVKRMVESANAMYQK